MAWEYIVGEDWYNASKLPFGAIAGGIFFLVFARKTRGNQKNQKTDSAKISFWFLICGVFHKKTKTPKTTNNPK